MIVLVVNVVLTIGLGIATLWTIWGVHRLTQQIKKLSEDHTEKDKQ